MGVHLLYIHQTKLTPPLLLKCLCQDRKRAAMHICVRYIDFSFVATIIQYDSSELGEELCPVSSSLPLSVNKVYIRVSFSDTFWRWLPPFVANSCHYQQRKNFPFYTLQGSGCVLISYSMLSLIIAWLG